MRYGVRTAIVSFVRQFRAIGRRPAQSAIIALSLTLGIAISVCAFDVLENLYWREPSGVERPGQVWRVRLGASEAGGILTYAPVASYPDFEDLKRAAAPSSIRLAAYVPLNLTTGRDGAPPIAVRASLVSPEFFEALGVRADRGRLPTPQEIDDGSLIAVVSARGLERLRRAGIDAGVGRFVDVGGVRVILTGTVTRFSGIDEENTDVWMPVGLSSSVGLPPLGMRTAGMLSLIARVPEGMSERQAGSALSAMLRSVDDDHGGRATGRGRVVTMGALRESRLHGPDARSRLIATGLEVIVGFALALAIGNTVLITLIRTMRDRATYATRLALGATQLRLATDQGRETAALAIGSIGAGVWLGLSRAGASAWLGIPGEGRGVGVRTGTFAVAAAGVVLLLIAAGPLLLTRRIRLAEALRAVPSAGGLPPALRRMCLVLVGVQVCASTALIASAVSLLSAVRTAYAFDYGFAIDQLYAIKPSFGGVGRDPISNGRVAEQLRRLRESILRDDAFVSASVGNLIPFRQIDETSQLLPSSDGQGWRSISYLSASVDAEFMRTARLRLMRGRWFQPGDGPHASSPVVVTQSFADQMTDTKGRDVVGRCLVGTEGEDCQPVVGVVADATVRDIRSPGGPMVFSLAQDSLLRAPILLLRARAGARDAAARIYRAASSSGQPMAGMSVLSISDLSRESSRASRTGMLAFAITSIAACLLAFVGTVIVVAYEASSRSTELGIRAALGASPARLLRTIGRHTALAALLSVAAGCGLGAGTVVVMRSMIVGATLAVWMPLLVAACAGILVTLVGMAIPGYRAVSRSPVTALRA
jgi:putative ABC transport system permease protein